jgi:hypothetical protein
VHEDFSFLQAMGARCAAAPTLLGGTQDKRSGSQCEVKYAPDWETSAPVTLSPELAELAGNGTFQFPTRKLRMLHTRWVSAADRREPPEACSGRSLCADHVWAGACWWEPGLTKTRGMHRSQCAFAPLWVAAAGDGPKCVGGLRPRETTAGTCWTCCGKVSPASRGIVL